MTTGGAGREGVEGPGIRRTHAYLRGVGGVRLFYRSWEPEGAEVRVVLVHGLGDHSGRWERVAETLSSRGLAVHAPDLRGHGRSRGRRGHAASFDDLLRDLDRLRRAADPQGRRRRVVLLGHSLGGLVVLRYLQAFPSPTVAGAAAAAPFFRLRAEVPEWKLTLGRLADRWLPGLTLDAELDRDELLRQPEERERYHRDPLVHQRISARLWGEMQREAGRVREDPRTHRPVLLQVAGDDRIVAPGAVEDIGRRLPSDVEVRVYPRAFHDLYHDPEAPDALRDLLEWVEAVTAGPA